MEKLDQYMAVEPEKLGSETYYEIPDSRFRLAGFHPWKNGKVFRRMPVMSGLSVGVDRYADQGTGGILYFRTDSPVIKVHARVKTLNNSADINTYSRLSFDLYSDGNFLSVCRHNFDAIKSFEFEYVSTLAENQPKAMRNYELYFPLYAEVEMLRIGLSPEAKVEPQPDFADPRPVVLYGTSIEHGCAASRAGLGPTNLLTRQLGMRFLNFGFSGSGKGEAIVAEQLAKIPDPRLYILSYDANVSAEELEKTLKLFCDVLRKAHPETPILTVSRLRYPREQENDPERLRLTAAHTANAARDPMIHFLDGRPILGDAYRECSLDGCHPNDLGFARFAEALIPEIRKLV